MTYKISRDGQEYGPYTLEELQQYVAEGSILATDYAFNGLEWVTVSQLLQDPQRGLATAHSVSSAAHAVSSVGDKSSQMNNPKTKSVLSSKVNDGCFPSILGIVGLWAIFGSNGNIGIIIFGCVFLFLGIIMYFAPGGSAGSSGGRGCSSCSSCSSCSGGSSCSSCGGGCGGCGGGE